MKKTWTLIFSTAVCAGLIFALTAATPSPDISSEALELAEGAANKVSAETTTKTESPPPACPRNYIFTPAKHGRDNATGCTDKKGQVRCYSRRHYPCMGVHTKGAAEWDEIRGGKTKRCVHVRKWPVYRCDGAFTVEGKCTGSTVTCGKVSTASSGEHFNKRPVQSFFK